MGTKADLYLAHLRDEGYRPELDDDGDVRFKSEGFTIYVICQESDASYFQMLLPGMWTIDDDEELGRALLASTKVTREVKTVKVYVSSNRKRVDASIEAFMDPITDFKAVFERYLGVLKHCTNRFKEAMHEQMPATH